MLRQIAMILPVFLAGVLLGAWAVEPDTSSAEYSSDSARDFDHAADYQRLEQMITSLTEIVNLEVSERRRLEAQIASLADQLAGLTGKPVSQDKPATADESKKRAMMNQRVRSSTALGTSSRELTEERFVNAGFQPDVAARLKRDMDQLALDRLYLRDQAVREGWLGTPRYRDELRALNARQENPRQELSTDDYDRYLYAMGRPNRVVVSSVLTGSPASEAGLQAGDAIISYDGSRTFSPSEIRRQTTSGSAGTLVPVEVLRDGQRMVIYLPRGPLGVNMGAVSVKP
ncbi:MAG: PDZ domain-containing protein [Gammaproteobacteria bacterium]|nr:PDZ domain-containing protein [Gammaproteobacteria bacterium]